MEEIKVAQPEESSVQMPQKGPEFRTKMSLKKDWKLNWPVYALFLPVLVYFIIFNYIPMVGVLMSFQDYSVSQGLFGSEWIGFANFVTLFTGNQFLLVLRNTVVMAVLNVIVGFAAPVIFALLLSEVRVRWFKRSAQIISYLPYFIAAVIVAQLLKEFCGSHGAITALMQALGYDGNNLLADNSPPTFWLINTFTEVWQGCGYGAIVFVAAIANVNGDLHEAAAIDGANRWQRAIRITLPCMLPFVTMMLTMKIGTMFMAGFDKILLVYSPSIYDVADCLSTYTYRMSFAASGLPNYALSAASGLFQSVVSTILLLVSNWLSGRLTHTALF